MFKKITAMFLAASTLLLCFGCAGKTGGDTDETTEKVISPESKIALIIGSEKVCPEAFTLAKALKERYGENLLVHSFADNYVNDVLAVTTIATEIAADETVKAMVFADAVEGTSHAVQRVRELRSDMCIIVCNAVEDIGKIAQNVNLVIRLDYNSIADKMVRNAADMGAKTFVFYTFQRHADYDYVASMRDAAAKAAADTGLKYVETFSVDAYAEGGSEESAKTFIGEDFYRKTQKYKKNIAFYSTDRLIEETLINKAAEQNYMIAGTATLSPVSFANAFKVDVKGHETDHKYMIAAITSAVAKTDDKGKMASWEFSTPMVTLEAGFEYAYSFLNNGATWTDNQQTLTNILSDLLNGTPFTLKKYSDSSEKVFLLDSDFYTY